MNRHGEKHMDENPTLDFTSEDHLRYMVLSAKDVRKFLSTGVVCIPSVGDIFAPGHECAGEWRRVFTESELQDAVPVLSPKDGCIAQLSDSLITPVPGKIEVPIPATMIERLLFTSEQLAKDWVGRSRNFRGLGPLPDAESDGRIQFIQAESTASEEPDTEKDRESLEEPTSNGHSQGDGLQRLSGGIVTVLSSSGMGSAWMQHLSEAPAIDRSTFTRLLECFSGLKAHLLEKVICVLAEDEWNSKTGAFDERAMLERFTKVLSCDVQIDKALNGWSVYVQEVLDNARSAREDEFKDEGQILLRSLQLMIRTKPLSIENIDVQVENYDGRIGFKVAALARVLTGWYQGFQHLGGNAKSKLFYSIGSRIATGCAEHPVRFDFTEVDEGTFDVRSSISEGGVELACDLKTPSHALKEFFHAAKSVLRAETWNIDYSRADSAMRFQKGEEIIVGTIEGEGSPDQCVHLTSRLNLKRPRGKSWPKGFKSGLLKIGGEIRCGISTSGYPDVSFHCHQLAATTDHDEIRFHLEAILDGKRKVHSMHQDLLG